MQHNYVHVLLSSCCIPTKKIKNEFNTVDSLWLLFKVVFAVVVIVIVVGFVGE